MVTEFRVVQGECHETREGDDSLLLNFGRNHLGQIDARPRA